MVCRSFINHNHRQESGCPIHLRSPRLGQCMKFKHYDRNLPTHAKSSRTMLTPVSIHLFKSLGYHSLTMEMTVVSLHSELRTIRQGICKSCKLKFQVPANILSQPVSSRQSTSQIHRFDIFLASSAESTSF
jgi:hypothetical protein